ncbi:thioredoxin-like protein 4B isoform X2 [Leopardus geoffroyi]|nr:thioredoxin-like protein 4B isoform X2 [Leopardus geoffroyi]XP_058563872.1 thioredoxin-like protein 4B isoform X1 [Neofelis nebulosa]
MCAGHLSFASPDALFPSLDCSRTTRLGCLLHLPCPLVPVTDSKDKYLDYGKMSFLLPKLTSKKEVDQAIKSTAEKVLVLRFGRDEDPVCLQLDDILSKTSSDLSKMAAIYLVDVDQTPVYTHYFDISYIPSTVFFFNGQHMKVDYGDSTSGSLFYRNSTRRVQRHMNRETPSSTACDVEQ